MKSIEINQFECVQSPSRLLLSEQGQPAFVLTTVEEGNYHSRLAIIEENQVKIMTQGHENLYLWQDNETLLFTSIRTEEQRKRIESQEELTCFYRLSLQGAEAMPAFELPLKVQAIEKIHAKKYLILAKVELDCPDYYRLSRAEQQEVIARRKEEADYQIISEQPYYFDGSGFTNGQRSRLFLYEEETDSLHPLSEPNMQVSQFVYHPLRNSVLFSGVLFNQVKPTKEGLYEYSLDNQQLRCLIEPNQVAIRSFVVLKGQIIVLLSKQERFGAVENPWFYRLEADTGELTLLLENEYSIGSAMGSDVYLGSNALCNVYDDHFVFVQTKGQKDAVMELDEEGIMRSLITVSGSIQAVIRKGDQLWMIAMLEQNLPELFCVDLNENQLQKISTLNELVLKDYYVAKPQPITIFAGDSTVEGWVLIPQNIDLSKKYPAILDIHGGPKMAYGEVFFHEMQYWVSQGYFVLYCNPRGSDGKGNDFAELRGQYGTIDYTDIMNFVDEVLRQYPCIDQARLGVTGGSYGGFMTNWIIGHTNRFAAAASQRSIANWISLICYADIGFTFDQDQVGANPWSDLQKVWDQSPLQFADRATTPTLFIHSFEDYRCVLQEGMQMYNALIYHGTEAKMCLFKKESHGLSRIGKPKHRVRRLKEITAWMDQHLKTKA